MALTPKLPNGLKDEDGWIVHGNYKKFYLYTVVPRLSQELGSKINPR